MGYSVIEMAVCVPLLLLSSAVFVASLKLRDYAASTFLGMMALGFFIVIVANLMLLSEM